MSDPLPTPSRIVAGPSTGFRLKRLLLAAFIFGFGVYSIYDGFYAYPRTNADARSKKITEPHGGFDIPFNIAMGIVLPPAGLALAAWVLYATRGRLELSDDTLGVPGHPPIPLSAVTSYDRRKWDRKGIALVTYQSGGQTGTFKLDDFAYQRAGTDQIFDRIEAAVAGPGIPPEAPTGVIGS